MKRCSKCGETKSLVQFSKDRTKKDGHRSHCLVCKRADNQRHSKRHYQENRQYYKEYFAKWRKEHPEYMSNWWKANPDSMVDHMFHHNSVRRLISPDLLIERVVKTQVLLRDEYTCQLCNEPLNMELGFEDRWASDYPTVDHIIPLSKGGEHSYSNCQAAHRRCNREKWDESPDLELVV